jgi:type II secretory pathway component PulK
MFDRLCKENGSVILFNVIIVVLIIFVLAMSLSRQVNLDLSLTEYSLAKQKAHYIAWAGWLYSVTLLKESAKAVDQKEIDTLYQCGIKSDQNKTLKNLFSHISLGENYFDVIAKNHALGFTDEERKINLNALSTGNDSVLTQLLIILGLDSDEANQIALAIVNWIKDDKKVINQSSEILRYRNKSRPYDHIDELLLIKGITPGLFKKLKEFVTVFPKEATQLSVNLNTASIEVITALGRSLNEATNTEPEDADSLAEKISDYRKGEDGTEGSDDDRVVDANQMQLNAKEKAIYLSMQQYATPISNIYRIRVEGIEAANKTSAVIEGVVTRKDYSILSWEQE